ncbi:MAG: urate hydroxylase PuuD [Verrucomicrobiota bacterium]
MDFNWSEWVNLLTRWLHLIFGISWVGQTYLFIRMDHSMAMPPDGKVQENSAGQMWMVHGGGFFVVEKLTGLKKLPFKLHWFKWESFLTWLTGIILLVVVYYMGGLMESAPHNITANMSIAIGIAAIILSWPIYEAVWRSPLGKSEFIGATVCFILLLAAAYGLKQVMPARAAFFHIGVILGTIMVTNVWMLIIPAQKQIIRSIESGQPADMQRAARARQSSKQNSYNSWPLLLIMVSNHFPIATYATKYSVWLLGLFILLGWLGAKIMRDGIRH